VSSHLSSDIQIEGDLNCSTDLIFDGTIQGNITSKGSLTIGQNATVNGNLKAEKAVIEGKVVGNGDFNSCRLSPTSVISGAVQGGQGAGLIPRCPVCPDVPLLFRGVLDSDASVLSHAKLSRTREIHTTMRTSQAVSQAAARVIAIHQMVLPRGTNPSGLPR
jgi:hypothetical protein